jgi:hypothetical protein
MLGAMVRRVRRVSMIRSNGIDGYNSLSGASLIHGDVAWK